MDRTAIVQQGWRDGVANGPFNAPTEGSNLILHVRRSSFFPRSTPIPPSTIKISDQDNLGLGWRKETKSLFWVQDGHFISLLSYLSIVLDQEGQQPLIEDSSHRSAAFRDTRDEASGDGHHCYCCAALDMAQVQRERNLREMNSPSTCGPRRAATIVSVIGRGCQVWLSLRIQYRYRSSLDRSCISRDSLVVATQSQRGGLFYPHSYPTGQASLLRILRPFLHSGDHLHP
jgi:hypothetical protein